MKSTFATKVVVKEVETKQAIVKAEVKGVQTIEVTMAKDVASLDNAKVTLKKNSSTKDSKATCDGKIITIKTDTKLTAGDYTITISGLEIEDLTASVNVEKNEYLKSYKIDEHLIAGGTYVNTWGYVYYQALNQYDEPMNADKPTVTCSFATKVEVTRAASATQEGRIEIGNADGNTSQQIPTTLAIAGTTGTIVLVDSNNGVNQSATITWSTAATADKVEVAGMYSTTKSKFQDIVAQDDPSDYFYLMKITDQYGHALDFNHVKDDLQMNIAGGITNVELNPTNIGDYLQDFTIGSEDYLAAKLKPAYARAGEATLTVVNNKKGLLLTQTITVGEYVVISNFVATDDYGIYASNKNQLGFEATDSNGNDVTSFDVLKRTVGFGDGRLYWEKNDDGSAKLIFDLREYDRGDLGITQNDSHTGSITKALTFYCNEPTSGKYLVKTNTYNIYQDKEVKSVLGLKADTTTQFSVTNGKLDIAFDKFVLADQYANKVTKADGSLWTNAMADLTEDLEDSDGISWSQVPDGIYATMNTVDNKFTFTLTGSTSSTDTLYFKNLCAINGGNDKKASASNYDYRLVVTAVDTKKIDNESIKIDSIKGGYTVYADEDLKADGITKTGTRTATITESAISVSGLVAGAKTAIPTSQLKIKSVKNNSFSATEIASGVKTKTASAVVQVTTFDASNNTIIKTLEKDFQVSYDASYAFELTSVSDYIRVPGNTFNSDDIIKVLTFKDQYGNPNKTWASNAGQKLTYKVVALHTTGIQVTGENVSNVRVDNLIAERNVPISFSITINTPNGKKENKTITGVFNSDLTSYSKATGQNVEIDADVATASAITPGAIENKLLTAHTETGYIVTPSVISIQNNTVKVGNKFNYKLQVAAVSAPGIVRTLNLTGTFTEKELTAVTISAITVVSAGGANVSSVNTGDAISGAAVTAAAATASAEAGAPSVTFVSGSISCTDEESISSGDAVTITLTLKVNEGFTYAPSTSITTVEPMFTNLTLESAVVTSYDPSIVTNQLLTVTLTYKL